MLLHISCNDTLTAEGLASVSIEELISLLMRGAFSKCEGFVPSRYTHVTLENSRLMEVSVMVKTEVGLIIDTVEFGWPRLLCLNTLIQILTIASCFFSSHTKVGLALLTDRCQRLNRIWNLDLRLDFIK